MLQPAVYTSIRGQLDALWGLSSRNSSPRQQTASPPAPEPGSPSPAPQASQSELGEKQSLPVLAAAAKSQQASPAQQAAQPVAAKAAGLLGGHQAQLPGFVHECPTMYIDEGAQRPVRDGSATASTSLQPMSDDEAWAQVCLSCLSGTAAVQQLA